MFTVSEFCILAYHIWWSIIGLEVTVGIFSNLKNIMGTDVSLRYTAAVGLCLE